MISIKAHLYPKINLRIKMCILFYRIMYFSIHYNSDYLIMYLLFLILFPAIRCILFHNTENTKYLT